VTNVVPIRPSRQPWLLLCLWLVGGAAPSVGVAGPPAPHGTASPVAISEPITLPIVDATDNRFLRLSAAEGASQTKVDFILQDDAGFMWFGTHYGLYRYDGYSFKGFVHQPENPGSLDCTDVRALFKDRAGALWVGCPKSLDRFDRTTERFTHYPIPLATHVTQDTRGYLWATTRGGLYRLDPTSGAVRLYSHDPSNPLSVSSNDLAYCGVNKEGSLWIASNAGLDEFDPRSGTVSRHIPLPDVQSSQAEEGLSVGFYEDRFGKLWIFHSSPNPLAVFDLASNTFTRYWLPEGAPTVTRVHAMLEDGRGTLWIATHGLGLLKLDREHGTFIRYANVPTDPESLPQDKLDALFADREGNIWVATGRMGAALHATAPAPFAKLPKVPGTTIQPAIGALFEDHQGVLWMGTPEGLFRVDRRQDKITATRWGNAADYTDVVSIVEDPSSNLWVGTWGHGLHHIDHRTGKSQTYRHDPADSHSLSSDIVMRLLFDHDKTLWVGTADGLNRFDAANERFTTFRLGSQTPLIRALVEDSDGKVWAGSDTGLLEFDPASARFAVAQHGTDALGRLGGNRVNSVRFDHTGTMWVGTQDGLNTRDPTGRVVAFTQLDGLPGNAVDCILEDKSGNLWMSTNNGVARFNPRARLFAGFSTADGLPGPNLTGGAACFQSSSGEMFFGGFNGGTAFFPDKVVDSSYAPPIVLTDFRLFGNSVPIGPHSALQKSISYTRELTLSHEQNVFSFTFAALSYLSPDTNRYRYRLDGLEREWNDVGSDRRQPIYTTLPAGTYTFRAQAATRGGPWSEPGVAVRITIEPAWWLTWWFKVLMGMLVLLGVAALYAMRVRQLHRQFDVTFEARVAERTRIARELHDTLLQSFHGLLLRFRTVHSLFLARPGEARQMLEGAIDEARKALTEGRQAVQGLRSAPLDSHEFSEAMKTLGEELANNSVQGNSVALSLSIEGTPRPLQPLVRDEIYKIGSEALRNAFRHAEASRIEVQLDYGKRHFELRILDDGRGIDPKLLNAGALPEHFGLTGMRERAKEIGAILTIWSAPSSGTELELTVPGRIAYEALQARHRSWLAKRLFAVWS